MDGSHEEVGQETFEPVEAIEGLEPPHTGIEVDHQVVVARGVRIAPRDRAEDADVGGALALGGAPDHRSMALQLVQAGDRVSAIERRDGSANGGEPLACLLLAATVHGLPDTTRQPDL